MKSLAVVGVLLVVAGVIALGVQYIPIRETRTVVDAGPIQIRTERDRNIPIPAIAGIIAVLAGLGLVVAGRRRA